MAGCSSPSSGYNRQIGAHDQAAMNMIFAARHRGQRLGVYTQRPLPLCFILPLNSHKSHEIRHDVTTTMPHQSPPSLSSVLAQASGKIRVFCVIINNDGIRTRPAVFCFCFCFCFVLLFFYYHPSTFPFYTARTHTHTHIHKSPFCLKTLSSLERPFLPPPLSFQRPTID